MTPKRMNSILRYSMVALIVLVVAGLYFANKTLTKLAGQVARLKADVVLQEKQLTAYKSTKETVDSLQDVGGLADKVLPEEQEQSLTVAELSAFAQRASLGIKDLTFTEPPVEAKGAKKKTKQKSAIPKNVTVTPLTITFEENARYDYFLDFLRSVEENQRKMQITNIALTPNETDRTLLEEVSVSINLYVKAAKTSATEKK
jgi:hypothetical protein